MVVAVGWGEKIFVLAWRKEKTARIGGGQFCGGRLCFSMEKNVKKRGGKSCSDRSLCSVTPQGERGEKKRGKKGKKETRKEKRTPARVPRKEPHFGPSCLQRGKAKERDLKKDN